MATESYTWTIDLTLPKGDQQQWTQNKHYNIVCRSAERAIELVRERHPGCVIIGVHRTGRDSQTIVDHLGEVT